MDAPKKGCATFVFVVSSKVTISVYHFPSMLIYCASEIYLSNYTSHEY